MATSRAEYIGPSSLMPYPSSYISAHKIARCEYFDKTGFQLDDARGFIWPVIGFHLADVLPYNWPIWLQLYIVGWLKMP